MTPFEAWQNIQARLELLRKIKRAEDPAYKQLGVDNEAEVLCYLAFKVYQNLQEGIDESDYSIE